MYYDKSSANHSVLFLISCVNRVHIYSVLIPVGAFVSLTNVLTNMLQLSFPELSVLGRQLPVHLHGPRAVLHVQSTARPVGVDQEGRCV